MRDIVATIQAEQDRGHPRRDLRGVLVVQGGPGTGKTAVALHRAAYLLYAHRRRLERSRRARRRAEPVFLRYIEEVLPSLGETGVVMQTLGELYPGVEAVGDDEPVAARLKGSAQMARLLSRAVRTRQKVPVDAQTVDINGERLVVEPDLIARAIDQGATWRQAAQRRRVAFVKQALSELDRASSPSSCGRRPTIDEADLKVLREDLRTSYDVRVLLNTAWLPLTPEKFIQDLYARPSWLAELTPRWTAGSARGARPRPAAPFTVSDVPLLDEAAELLGAFPGKPDAGARERDRQRKRDLENARAAIRNMGVEGLVSAEQLADGFAERVDFGTTAERAAADRTWTYGHVVVDEAQELSPMQWRVLVRRCPMKSFTIVGDIAQVASPAGATSWQSALTPSFKDAWRLEELTVNYRTPAQITREAERLAESAGLPITPTRAVREGEWPIRRVSANGNGLGESGGRGRGGRPGDRLGGNGRRDRPGGGSGCGGSGRRTALRCAGGARCGRALPPDRRTDRLRGEGPGVRRGRARRPGCPGRGVPRGAASLYVAMTRPTQRLTLVTR